MKIKDYRQFDSGYDCKEVRDLLMLYVLNQGDLSLDERNHIGSHLEKCASCREEYKQTILVNDVLIANRDFFIREKVFGDSRLVADSEPLSDEEVDFLQFQGKMERAFARRKRAERRAMWERLRPALKIASTAAACLVIGLGGFWAVSQFNEISNEQKMVASGKLLNAVKIELISGSQVEILPAGQPVFALNELKTLRINGNRQMVLNVGTKLSIEPYNLGCIVKLDKGEIYTEVEHDGKSFVVETVHGRAVITGTTFHIKADESRMELAVVEGSVRLESEEGVVNVSGGYQSIVANGSLPTRPLAVDSATVARWAKRQSSEVSAPVISHDLRLEEIPELISVSLSYQDLEDIDFDVWIEQYRAWFEREFPCILLIKDAFVKEGIQVDYPELLLKSNLLWHYEHPAKSSTQLAIVNREKLLSLVIEYGKDKQWLTSKVGALDCFDAAPVTRIEILNEWADADSLNMQQIDGDLLFSTLHANIYLAKTRTLIWLGINEGIVNLTSIEKMELHNLLKEEIKYVLACTIEIIRLMYQTGDHGSCALDRAHPSIEGVREKVRQINVLERKLAHMLERARDKD